MKNLTDSEKKILERLEAATPGPWTTEEKELWYGTQVPELDVFVEGCVGRADFVSDNDAKFIANAPTDIRQLLTTISELREENERLIREVVNRNARALEGDKAVAVREKHVDRIIELGDKLTAHKAAAQKLMEALEPFYDFTKNGMAFRPGSFRITGTEWETFRKAFETYKREIGE